MNIVFEWLDRHSAAIWWVAIASAAMLGATLLAVPWIIVRLPADYFVRTDRPRTKRAGRSWTWIIWLIGRVVKNVLGLALLVLGCLMLILPGQGLLTILFAVALLDFPGKYRLRRWIVSRRGVLQSINWLRERAGKEPLILQ